MGPRLLIINTAHVHLLTNVPKDSYLIFLQDIVQEGEFGGQNIFKLTIQLAMTQYSSPKCCTWSFINTFSEC